MPNTKPPLWKRILGHGLTWFIAALFARLYVFAAVSAVPAGQQVPLYLTIIGLAADSVMIGSVVELLFQYRTISDVRDLLSDSLRDLFALSDEFLSGLGASSLKNVRRRVTERIIDAHLATDDLYESMMLKTDELLQLPVVTQASIHRRYEFDLDEQCWLVTHTHTTVWRNELDRSIEHEFKSGITYPSAPVTVPTMELTIGNEAVDATPDIETGKDGKIAYEWRLVREIPPGGQVKMSRVDTRHVPIDDHWTFRPLSPVKQLVVTCHFPTTVHPVIEFFGYKADHCDHPINEDEHCQLTVDGWMLPQHVVLVTWSVEAALEELKARKQAAQRA